ncbi:MAG: helix-turn-helix domain-containing protein, partial [Immundisolibacteraceae bacterium]|nr:helix-turn-helix domain-containing protein [Immundisolibacteraceae bacterium]
MSKGIKFGRKRSINRNKVLEQRKQGVSAIQIAKNFRIARSTVYKLLKEEEF